MFLVNRLEIESTCPRCGVVIFGNVSDGLPTEEAAHLEACRGIARQKAAGD